MPARVDREREARSRRRTRARPAGGERPDGARVHCGRAGAVAVQEPVDADAAGRGRIPGGRSRSRSRARSCRPATDVTRCVRRVVDRGRRRRGELGDRAARPAPPCGGFGTQFVLPVCGRVVAEVVPGQRGGVGEDVAGEVEVGGLHRVEGERLDVEPRAEGERARRRVRRAERIPAVPVPVAPGQVGGVEKPGRNAPISNLSEPNDVARGHVAARGVHRVVQAVDRQRVLRLVDVCSGSSTSTNTADRSASGSHSPS